MSQTHYDVPDLLCNTSFDAPHATHRLCFPLRGTPRYFETTSPRVRHLSYCSSLSPAKTRTIAARPLVIGPRMVLHVVGMAANHFARQRCPGAINLDPSFRRISTEVKTLPWERDPICMRNPAEAGRRSRGSFLLSLGCPSFYRMPSGGIYAPKLEESSCFLPSFRKKFFTAFGSTENHSPSPRCSAKELCANCSSTRMFSL